eukprot:UN04304
MKKIVEDKNVWWKKAANQRTDYDDKMVEYVKQFKERYNINSDDKKQQEDIDPNDEDLLIKKEIKKLEDTEFEIFCT